MRMVETEADGVMVVEAHGRLDSTTSEAFADRLTSLLETGHGALVVDLKSIAYISSVGFQALLKASRAATRLGCKLALCGVTGRLRRDRSLLSQGRPPFEFDWHANA